MVPLFVRSISFYSACLKSLIDHHYASFDHAYFCARLQNNVQQTPAERERAQPGLKWDKVRLVQSG